MNSELSTPFRIQPSKHAETITDCKRFRSQETKRVRPVLDYYTHAHTHHTAHQSTEITFEKRSGECASSSRF